MNLNWPRIWGIVAMAAGVAASAVSTAGQPGKTAIACINPASGARWQVMIDFAKSTVDANPAKITDAEISWRDAKDGANYTLDRKSGKLTMVAASSTGGYFLYDRCELKGAG